MPGKNTLAYNKNSQITDVKSFITLTTGLLRGGSEAAPETYRGTEDRESSTEEQVQVRTAGATTICMTAFNLTTLRQSGADVIKHFWSKFTLFL